MPGSALDGVTVVELCSFVAGPYCTKLMADMGADVVKVEPPAGDEARRRGPFYSGEGHEDVPGPDSSLLFTALNSNKRGVTLDTDTARGRGLLGELLEGADLLVEDLPASTAQRIGLDYPTLGQALPGLVVTSITPYGRSGPYRDYVAHYLNSYHAGGDGYMLPGGRLADQLYPEREPIKAGGYLGEYQAGLSGAVASMGALVTRLADGRGRHIDVSKQEALINLNSADFCLYPDRGIMENRRGRYFPHYVGGLYRCKDGFWHFLIPSQRQWDAMVKVMGEPQWTREERFATHESRVAHREDLDELIEAWALDHTRDDIFHSLQQEGCASGPVYSTTELLQDPQMESRGYFAEAQHPIMGTFRVPSAGYQLSHTPWALRRPAPSLGQHNVEIYGGWLGYGGTDLAGFRRQGVI